jgi:cation transport ATPase
MTHTYNISGMTCDGCSAKVSYLFKQLPDVTDVTVNLDAGEASATMAKHIPTTELQTALKDYPKYQLSEKDRQQTAPNVFDSQQGEQKSWAATYKPILLIFGYITIISAIAAVYDGVFSFMTFMRIFMSGFFLTFSFFKLLDINGFAESYAMYDIIAKKFKGWGYVYVFTELSLGLAFALDIAPVAVNAVTAIVMSVSLIGVLQSVLNKKTIRCACLGAVFNLPMSTVTIIEDGLMIIMSLIMLFMYI